MAVQWAPRWADHRSHQRWCDCQCSLQPPPPYFFHIVIYRIGIGRLSVETTLENVRDFLWTLCAMACSIHTQTCKRPPPSYARRLVHSRFFSVCVCSSRLLRFLYLERLRLLQFIYFVFFFIHPMQWLHTHTHTIAHAHTIHCRDAVATVAAVFWRIIIETNFTHCTNAFQDAYTDGTHK